MTTFRWATLTIFLVAAPLAAQQASVTAPKAASDSAEVMNLSLDKAIAIAIEQNLGVHLQKINVLDSEQSAKSAFGQFDPMGTAQLQKSHDEKAVTSVIVASKTEQELANLGLKQNLPTGASYSVAFDNRKTDSPYAYATVNPSYNSGLTFSFSQPLLKNFGVDVTTSNVRIARNTLGVSEETFKSEMIQTVLAVEKAYYNLVYARQNLDVVKEALFLAKDQARITQIRINVGASAPLDILQPNVNIAADEENEIVAQAAIRNAEDQLRQLLNLAPDEWERSIVPTDEATYKPMKIDVEKAVETAYANRPEIRSAELNIRNAKINNVYRRNQRLPQVDLQVSYGYAGTGGTQIRDPQTLEPITPIPGGLGDALDQIKSSSFPSWTVGFNVSVPIKNTSARAEAKRAQLNLQRQMTTMDQTRQNIAVQVRQAVRDIDTAAKSIVASKASREAAEKNLDAERKKFDNGMVTNFEVLSAQSDLSAARGREISALVQYAQAIASYHVAIGDLLKVHDIEVAVPKMPAVPYQSWSKHSWLNFSHSGK